MQKNYTILFEARYKVLGHFADDLFATCSDYDFFRIIATNIVPLICNGKAYEYFFLRFNRDKASYVESNDAFVAEAPFEVEEAFAKLQKIFAGNASFEIQQRLEEIRDVFNNKCNYGIPPYLQVAYEKINSLLQLLLDSGEAALVREFAKIEQQTVNSYNQNSELESEQKWVIKEFTYVPSLQSLNKLKEVLDWRAIRDTWVAWEYLYLVFWCWNIPFSFFADKSLSWKDYESSISSTKFLALHEHWAEVNAIKNVAYGKKEQQSLLFQRSVFINFIKIILNDILLQQELEKGLSEEDELALDKVVPEILTIRLNDKMANYKACLQLNVKWGDGGSEDILLHTFQDDSGPYSFVMNLLTKPINTHIDIREVSNSSGGTVVKYLKQSGFSALLIKLFIEGPKNHSTHIAFMKTKSIRYDELSKEHKIGIMKFIKNCMLRNRPIL